jgi:hypothetical protein
MVHRSTLIRTVRRVGICLVVSFVVLNVFLRVETYRFQRRAERLIADVQALKLRQSSWLEAGRLISRWGKYGNYKGHCDAYFCRYSVVLESPETTFEGWALADLNDHFVYPTASLFFALCEHLGGRSVTVRATFVVQDSVVLRKSAVFIYNVPPTLSVSSGYSLIATSRAANRLTSDSWWSGREQQLIEHPFYVVTRPSGCTFCLMANVVFTPDTPYDQMQRLTTFDLGCITRLRPCSYLEEIYPAAEEWHLYDGTLGGRPSPLTSARTEDVPLPLACRVPLDVRGREANQILSVTVVSESQERKPDEIVQRAMVRVDDSLTGSTIYRPGNLVTVTSRSDPFYVPLAIETPLEPGRRFLLLSLFPQDEKLGLEFEHCLIIPDTPDARNQLAKGVAQNDSLRDPDPHFSAFIPD